MWKRTFFVLFAVVVVVAVRFIASFLGLFLCIGRYEESWFWEFYFFVLLNMDIEIPFFNGEIFKSFDMLTVAQIVLRVAIAASNRN